MLSLALFHAFYRIMLYANYAYVLQKNAAQHNKSQNVPYMSSLSTQCLVTVHYYCDSVSLTDICDFKDGFCNWFNSAADDFDWTLHSGKTPSDNTGPGRDYTGYGV